MQMRPRFYSLQDTSKACDMATRQDMVRYSRELFAGMGNLGGAIVEKNQWAFGDGWSPQYQGTNQAWGEQVENWLKSKFFPVCNVRGPNYDFRTSLFLLGCALDVDGDALLVLTASRDGFPLIQLVPAHRIGQRSMAEKEVKAGRYRGNAICDGVITNGLGRPIAYRILGDTPDEDQDLSAQSAMLLTEPTWADQIRGIPRIARTVLDLMDLQDLDVMLKRMVKNQSIISLIAKTRSGEADITTSQLLTANEDAIIATQVTNPQSGVGAELVFGGEMRYLHTDEDITPFTPDSPSPNTENFISRIERRCLYSVGWPVEMMDATKIGGASVRLIQDLARKSIRTRQNTVERAVRFFINYAVATAMANELIPANYNDNWYAWTFTRPASVCVDNGNESSADRDNYKLGTATLAEIAAKKGQDWLELRNQSQKETEDLLDRAKAVSTKYNISLDKALALLSQRTPNEAPASNLDSAKADKTNP